jgi:hypothetical protein
MAVFVVILLTMLVLVIGIRIPLLMAVAIVVMALLWLSRHDCVSKTLTEGKSVSCCLFLDLPITSLPIDQYQRGEKLGSVWLVDMKDLTADEFENLH